MTVNPLNHLRREPVLLLLLALSAGCAVVAALAARDSVTALIGALLVVAYWAIERLAMRVGRRGAFQWAMAVALVGTALRLAIVVGGLVIVALVDRSGFVEALVSFVVVYTIYLGVRLWRYPVARADRASGHLPTSHRGNSL